MTRYVQHLKTPLGAMEIEANQDGVLSIHFVDEVGDDNPSSITKRTKQQLCEYFSGEREVFDLPLNASGTKFQQSVWKALSTIGFGKTCSYSDIARQIKNPRAMRAVGAANGKNPLAIVVPCHRVIASNGTLSGYASGTDRKQWLLNHEANNVFGYLTQKRL